MKAKPTRRYSTLASVSWTAFQHIVRLADAAQIPLGGGALGIANQLIEMYNVADDNKNACAALVGTVAVYSETIWEFVQAMDPVYVKESEDKGAHVARNGIRRFGTALDEVSLTLKQISGKGKLKGMLSGSITKDQLSDCDTRLRQEHDRFNGSRMNVLVAGVQDLSTKPEAKPKITEYQILGARRLQPSEIELISQPSSHFIGQDAVSIARLCDTLFCAKVDGRVRMVKIYYDKSGGKDAFHNDMVFFEKNLHPTVLGVYGYCDTTTVPLLVFRDEKLRSGEEYFIDVIFPDTRLNRWRKSWEWFRSIEFLLRLHQWKCNIADSVVVNERDQIVLTAAAHETQLEETERLARSFQPITREMGHWWDQIELDLNKGRAKNRGLWEFEFCSRFSFWSAKAEEIVSSKLWIGDFGICIVHPWKPATFRKLGNILNEPWTDLVVPSFPYGMHQILLHKNGRFKLCVGRGTTKMREVDEDDADPSDPSESSSFHLPRTRSMDQSAITLDDVYPRRIGRPDDDDWVYDGKMHCNLESRAKNFFETHWTRLKMRYDVDPTDLVVVYRLEAPVREDSGICNRVWSPEDETYKPSLCRDGPRPSVTIAPTIQFGPHIHPDPRNYCSMEGAYAEEAPSSKSHHCCSHNITFAVDVRDPQTKFTFLRPPLAGFPECDDIIDTMPGAWPIREVA